jgi:hypothetical protein
MTDEFEVPAIMIRHEMIPTVVARVERFNEKMAKRGIAGRAVVSFVNDRLIKETETIEGRWVDVVFEMPTMVTEHGWTFVAALDHIGGRIVVRPMEGETVPPFAYDVEPGRCDHCRMDRRRNTSYLIRRGDDNFKVVGSSCVADFMGHSAPDILRLHGERGGLFEDDSRVERENFIKVDDLLTIASMAVAPEGWWIKSQEPGATIHVVRDLLFGGKPAKMWMEDVYLKNDAYPAQAEAIKAETIKGIEEMNADSEWAQNIKTLYEVGYVNIRKHLAIFASAVTIGLRRIRQTQERKAVRNEWIGTVGSKVTVDASVTGVKVTESYYGASYLYTFVTPNGELIKWFASRSQGIEQGTNVRVSGTVKKLDEYNGRKTTMLTRCHVEAI